MKAITTGIIGCGPRGHGHARAAMEGGALNVKYACDIRQERLDKAAAEWSAEGVKDYREILTDPEVEAVNVVTDVANHLHIVRDALAAGKHVICEKPFGDDMAAARELTELAGDADRVAYISFQLRFAGNYAALKDACEEIDPIQIFLGRSRGMMRDSFLNPSPFCGVMDVCAHDFDLVAWLMGRRPEAVTAVVRRNTFTRDTDATDTISALIDFDDGRSASVLLTIGAPEIGSKCDVAGSMGNARIEKGGAQAGVRFERYDSAGDKQPIDFSGVQGGNRDVALQQAFQREIRTGTPSRAARFSDGLNSLLLTMACLKSSAEKRRVCLDEVT